MKCAMCYDLIMRLDLFSILLWSVWVLMIVMSLSDLLTQRKKPTSIVAWVLVIFFIPYAGVVLYLIFQGRKMKRLLGRLEPFEMVHRYENHPLGRSEIARFIARINHIYPSDANRFELALDSAQAKEKLLSMIEEAQHTIYISTYIFGSDSFSRTILQKLTQKSQEGVTVKLLIDAIGSFWLIFYPRLFKSFKRSGGAVCFFMSPLQDPFRVKLNLRNHRKMVIVDGYRVMSGGINLSGEYFDNGGRGWIDISFFIEGIAATHYLQIFAHNWYFQTGERIVQKRLEANLIERGKSLIQVLPSGPDMPQDTLYEALLLAIFGAKDRIWIVTPYFAPDHALMDALLIAKHRGVDVRVVTPLSSDHFWVDTARSAFLRELESEGVKCYLYRTKMLHAKAILIDSETAIVGSANFDARSFFYNFEVMSFCYSYEDIVAIERWIEPLFFEAEVGLKRAGRVRIMVENFFKMFAPAL